MAAITSISLAIDSSSVSLDNVLINEVETFNRDQSRRMTFTRDCVLPEDDTWLHKTIELAINGSIVFTGTVALRQIGLHAQACQRCFQLVSRIG